MSMLCTGPVNKPPLLLSLEMACIQGLCCLSLCCLKSKGWRQPRQGREVQQEDLKIKVRSKGKQRVRESAVFSCTNWQSHLAYPGSSSWCHLRTNKGALFQAFSTFLQKKLMGLNSSNSWSKKGTSLVIQIEIRKDSATEHIPGRAGPISRK